jgi:hypothetical protein
MDSNQIVKAVIYPAVGIARVGNAPVNAEEDYFLGPEVPGQVPDPPGGFKDEEGRVKKQGARFRVYGLDKDENVVKEITLEDADISWRVHIANRKSGWYQFNNALDLEGLAIPSSFRNAQVADRSQLIIDPGKRTIGGKNVSGGAYQFSDGTFMGTPVPLGELRTDGKGRLIVLGGDGHSASYKDTPAVTFANNDTWHDDISDGPVRATITFKDGATLEAEPAMVAVTPPNFGQGLYGVVTMFDVIYDMNVRESLVKMPEQADFWGDIYPILNRVSQTAWVNQGFFMLFGQNSPSDFNQPDMLARLSSQDPANAPLRRRVFNWFRAPDNSAYQPDKIPPFYGDAFGEYENMAEVDLPLTQVQYDLMKQWAEGSFTTNNPPVYHHLEEVPLQDQPMTLTRANLDDCLGGPFHPGIELTWVMRVPLMWESPFRLHIMAETESPVDDWGSLLSPKVALQADGPLAKSGPGTLTRWLGIPWQTDEASCLSGYTPSTYLPLPSFWAARVPNQVLSADSFKRLTDQGLNTPQRLKHFDYRQDWLRDFGTVYKEKINAMIDKWHNLGIIIQHKADPGVTGDALPDSYWVETGRNDFNSPDPSFEQVLYAEDAEKPTKEKLTKLLTVAAAVEAPETAPKRPRHVARRDEK